MLKTLLLPTLLTLSPGDLCAWMPAATERSAPVEPDGGPDPEAPPVDVQEPLVELASEPEPLGEQTPAFRAFLAARDSDAVALLPDFSFAGYRRGEQPIPDVDHPIVDVTDFGALPDDLVDDRDALQRAFDHAAAEAPAVVRFPPGRFLLGPLAGPAPEPLTLFAGDVVLRGSGAGLAGGPVTELFQPHALEAKDPTKLWTTPYVLQLGSKGTARRELTRIVEPAARASFEVVVADASGIRAGDWLLLRSRDPRANARLLAPYAVEPEWTRMLEGGVELIERHRVAAVTGARVRLFEPLRVAVDPELGWTVSSFEHVSGVGVEDLCLRGNWKATFRHHEDAIHDGGWSLLSMRGCVDSWIRRCRFVDVNRPFVLSRVANCSVLDSRTEGNRGHHATGLSEASNCLVARYEDRADHWHGPGVQARCTGNVFHAVTWGPTTSFEAHASYPLATLFDRCRGALMQGHMGGDVRALPNHLAWLTFWNFEQIGPPVERYQFWRPRKQGRHGRVLPPILVGWHGPAAAASSFDEAQLALLEGYGERVEPDSLWRAQLAARLGAAPAWLSARDRDTASDTPSRLLDDTVPDVPDPPDPRR